MLFFVMILVVYYESQLDALNLSSSAAARRACNAIAAQVNNMAAAGANASAPLFIPESGLNYTIFVSAANRSVSISYGSGGAGCGISTANVSNGTDYSFFVRRGAMVGNVDGGVVIG